jgi:hypothetical protein
MILKAAESEEAAAKAMTELMAEGAGADSTSLEDYMENMEIIEAVRKAKLEYKYAKYDYEQLEKRTNWSALIKTRRSTNYVDTQTTLNTNK